MGILNKFGLSGITKGITGGARAGKTTYPRTLDGDALGLGDDSLKAGKWILIGEFKVGAQQRATIGQGTTKLDPMEQGRPIIKLQDTTPALIKGKIKLTHESAQGTKTEKVLAETSDAFNESTKSERLVLPRWTSKKGSPVKEDSYIRVYAKANADNTISASDSKIRLPVTIWE